MNETYLPALSWKHQLKPEYRNIPMWEFVSLDPVFEEKGYSHLKGMYMINKLYWIWNIKRNKVYTNLRDSKSNKYKSFYFGDRHKGRCWETPIHIPFGCLFLSNSNPETKDRLDHKDRNRSNPSLENIRWVSPKENRNNSTPPRTDRLAFDIYDSEYNFIERKLREELKQENPKLPAAIDRGMKRYGKYKNKIYKRIDLDVEEYILKYGPPVNRDWDPLHPELGGWIEHWEFPNEWFNSNGYHRDKDGIISVGYRGAESSYWTREFYKLKEINGEKKAMSRLILGGFLHIPYKDLLQVDHIDTHPDHNSLTNLRNVTATENMNNLLTKEKFCKPVVKLDSVPPYKILEEYPSLKVASDILGVDYQGISGCCSYKYLICKGFPWAFKGQEEEKRKQLIEANFNINNLSQKRKGYWTEENILSAALNCTSFNEFKQEYRSSAYKAAKRKGLDIKIQKLFKKEE